LVAQHPTTPPAATVLTVQARVTSVVDGDTLKVRLADGARTTVRLIGIDTPETKKPGTPVQCGGRDATARMKQLALRDGWGRQDLSDRYGRLLSYVGAGGDDFGRVMVASGWAKTYVYGGTDFQRVAAYRRAQRAARSAHKGVHRKCAGDFHRASTTARSARG
jgi:micrococcal nuclease